MKEQAGFEPLFKTGKGIQSKLIQVKRSLSLTKCVMFSKSSGCKLLSHLLPQCCSPLVTY